MQHLLDIADAPITEENTEIFTDIVAALVRIANEDNTNEFEELGHQLDNANWPPAFISSVHGVTCCKLG